MKQHETHLVEVQNEQWIDKNNQKRENSLFSTIFSGPVNLESQHGAVPIRSAYLLGISLFIYVIIYALFFNLHFSVDSYVLIYDANISLVHLQSGRPTAALITSLIMLFGGNAVLSQLYGIIALILSLVLSTTILTKQITKFFPKMPVGRALIIYAAVLLAFVNVLFVEWFMFPEAAILIAVGVLLTNCAIVVITEKSSIGKFFLSGVLILIAVNVYQVFFELYVIFALAIILVKREMQFTKKAFWECFVVLMIAGSACILNIAVGKLVSVVFNISQNARSASFDINMILQNIGKVFNFQRGLWYDTLTLLPSYTMLLFVGAMLLLFFFASLRSSKKTLLNILYWLAILVGCYFISFFPHYISPIFWPAQRTIFPLFSLFSLLSIMICRLENSNFIRYCTLFALLVFLSLNIIHIQQIACDQIVTNKMDKEYSSLVASEIDSYEKETGITIENISVVNDMSPMWGYYTYVDKIVYDTNISGKVVAYTVVPMINYYTGLNLNMLPMDDKIYETYFKDRDWSQFDAAEQIVFEDNTAYLVVY